MGLAWAVRDECTCSFEPFLLRHSFWRLQKPSGTILKGREWECCHGRLPKGVCCSLLPDFLPYLGPAITHLKDAMGAYFIAKTGDLARR